MVEVPSTLNIFVLCLKKKEMLEVKEWITITNLHFGVYLTKKYPLLLIYLIICSKRLLWSITKLILLCRGYRYTFSYFLWNHATLVVYFITALALCTNDYLRCSHGMKRHSKSHTVCEILDSLHDYTMRCLLKC